MKYCALYFLFGYCLSSTNVTPVLCEKTTWALSVSQTHTHSCFVHWCTLSTKNSPWHPVGIQLFMDEWMKEKYLRIPISQLLFPQSPSWDLTAKQEIFFKTKIIHADRVWDGWMGSLTQWTWIWVSSRNVDVQRSLTSCSPWGWRESNTTELLNWTGLNALFFLFFIFLKIYLF